VVSTTIDYTVLQTTHAKEVLLFQKYRYRLVCTIGEILSQNTQKTIVFFKYIEEFEERLFDLPKVIGLLYHFCL
jgi:hypothetical protein